MDPAFKAAGQKTGIQVWRVESLRLVAVADKDFGVFYEGDSYIILQTISMKSGGFSWNIHFWLGTHTSQDEAGVAAIKTVELDNNLGGGPVQYRETQGHESKQFLSYFKKGIHYLTGGAASGFRHVDRDHFETRLMHVKGKRTVRVQEIKPVMWSSINAGDVFILDMGRDIFCWNGKDSNRMERLKGIQVAQQIRDDMRGGNAKILVFDQNDGSTDPKFSHAIGGSMADIKPAGDAGDDEAFVRKHLNETKLYKVSDSSGQLVLSEVGAKPLTHDLLDSKDCFVVDQGPAGIFVWKGKGATKNEKDSAFTNAVAFIKTKKYPPHTQVTCVLDGAEPPSFKMLFQNWRGKYDSTGMGKTFTRGKIATTCQTKFDVQSMHSHPELAADTGLVDDGTGDLKIWRVESFDLVPVDSTLYGQFFGGDCYIIFYTYLVNGAEKYLIYYWLGSESSSDEQGTAALKTVEMDDEYGGMPVQVRVVQGKEPEHFLTLFKGALIIHKGGKASGFSNTQQKDACYTGGNRMFQVHGTRDITIRALEVECTAASLNSNDPFLIQTPQTMFFWCGKGCSGDEREFSKKIARKISKKELQLLPEGQESAEVWDVLGGKADYASGKRFGDVDAHEPRLFQCSNASGSFVVEEVANYGQEDLIEDDVMILDTWNELFIWIGNGANQQERQQALISAQEYIMTDPSGRDPDLAVFQVKQGAEPIIFTGHFVPWDAGKWQNMPTYEQMKEALAQGGGGVELLADSLHSLKTKNIGALKIYTMEQLCRRPVPDDVDIVNKEKHLSEEEFLQVFKMSKAEYEGVPKWKQNNLKKAANLF